MQGRALTNAIGNLELTGEYAEALKQLGQNLEDVASQVRFVYETWFVVCSETLPCTFIISNTPTH